ncbi:HAD family hydrolase [Propionicimonas sp.]|uniref:HAD family hydrolase n=1 Tax=Propionicimonas sp. TaxID=1955623 RepID=UPI00183B5F2D|nr:HAD family hydrolase [Propionicimonas sp.]MBU3975867.1 Cof-type HAD-IIB family hydrolase [Actinomycetota bacterium]MBA3022146.1 HAD family phosphatase [Propionicimonas sp.]MBU3987417.1 Cof-type HAD-IIB family hydrolase [Actinomycetota bacterium]MBU4006638.1 Cof-type HAD-IIB family hydrolase [Actinomycetota bacterium]MBU4065243.1 Cof-type HAD-IIB family hydrolase [Actinomycetota bacterium]
MKNSNYADWKPRVVALDIDGTIVDHEGVLPNEMRRTIRRIAMAGVPVVLTTGRSWHATRPVFEELELPPGPAISSNGAVIAQFPPFELLSTVTFDPSDVVAKVLREHPTAALAAEVVGTGYRVTQPFPDGELFGDIEVVSPEELAGSDVTRIVVRDPNSSDAEFITLANKLGLKGVSYFVGWSAWLDIAPAGVSKATGLAEVVGGLGFTAADVLAIGDGRNDIEMLAWAGRGVAVGDACADVQAVADHVTGTFADGGTIEELERWFGRTRAGARSRLAAIV